MLGLVPFLRASHPSTTLDKFYFLVDHLSDSHHLTTAISFTSLLALVVLRWFKNRPWCKKRWWIYRVPEVLVVVIGATILSDQFDWDESAVDILGTVPINTGDGSFIQIPFRKANLKFMQRTTSTAV